MELLIDVLTTGRQRTGRMETNTKQVWRGRAANGLWDSASITRQQRHGNLLLENGATSKSHRDWSVLVLASSGEPTSGNHAAVPSIGAYFIVSEPSCDFQQCTFVSDTSNWDVRSPCH